jgi:hypothetical protein
MLDRYILEDARESYDFDVCSEEIWTWLKNKYDCDLEVKRQYVKPANMWYTKVELYLSKVPVYFYNG